MMSVYDTPPTKEGTIPYLVPGANKECYTFYKVFGDLKAGKTPLVLLHGGPGLSHDVMLSLLPLHLKNGIPLVLYDQIGNAGSTHLPEKNGDEEFWSEELFHRELANLLKTLGLEERGYDLLGHSWGGMFGSTFAGTQPNGLRKLVLSNAPAELQPFTDAFLAYRRELPQETQDAMTRHEEAGTADGEEYQAIMDVEFFKKHICTVATPLPDEFKKTMEWGGKDDTVGVTMNGTNEFENGGSQRNWSASERVKSIVVPTLVINGTGEGVTDEAVRPFVEGIKSAKWVKLQNSTHMPMYEEPDRYFEALVDFLEGS